MSLIDRLSDVLEHPALYLAYQTLVGGIRARRKCILEYVKPTPGLVVLDIGCGPGYAITYFPHPEYYGFDVSERYIRFAKARFSECGHFYCQLFDEQTLTWLPRVDVVLLMGVLHHLDDASAQQLLDLIRRAMKPEGRLITQDGCYREGQSVIERAFLDKDRGRHIRKEREYAKIASGVFNRVESSVRTDFFYIPYTTVVLEC